MIILNNYSTADNFYDKGLWSRTAGVRIMTPYDKIPGYVSGCAGGVELRSR